MENISAVIAAGGLGTRLKNYKHNISTKVLIDINQFSMISLQITQLHNWGIKKFVVITNPEYDLLIKKDLELNHPEKNISFAIQEKPLGIAHALKMAENLVPKNTRILFILGDNFFQKNPLESIDFEQNDQSILVLKYVRNPEEFGVANVIDNNLIDIVEKPKNPISNMAVLGLYLYSYDCFKLIEQLEFSDRGELEISDLNNLLIQNNNVSYVVYDFWWIDAGTEERIEELKKLI